MTPGNKLVSIAVILMLILWALFSWSFAPGVCFQTGDGVIWNCETRFKGVFYATGVESVLYKYIEKCNPKTSSYRTTSLLALDHIGSLPFSLVEGAWQVPYRAGEEIELANKDANKEPLIACAQKNGLQYFVSKLNGDK